MAPGLFDESADEKAKKFYKYLVSLTVKAVCAREKNEEEKKEIIITLTHAIDRLPDKAREMKAYFHMLAAYANGKEHNQYRENIPKELWEMFEKARTSGVTST
jgi:hypothetical protein